MSDITYEFAFVDVIDHTGRPQKEMAFGIKKVMPYGNSPVFAIPLSSAWKYNEPEYMAHATRQIAEFLGMFPDLFLMKRIANLILNYLPDLIASKPYPHDEIDGRECGEGKLIIDGSEVQHFAMMTNGRFLH